ncbi:hypothetical protein [Streptomyces sp. NBC_00370]|uniref:hypothetical protein n=1 Tax=Streptomyces sp. NBC_00370 TaxID=2975728 RepID=UPI002E2765C9
MSEEWQYQDSPRGAQGHLQRVSDSVVAPDLWASYAELLDHVDGDLDDLGDHTKGCTKCRLSHDGSMCHTGHQLWLKARKTRS